MSFYPYFPNNYFPLQSATPDDYPDVANVLETDTVGGVPGTYHEALAGEVQYGVLFGPASAYTGTYGQSALGSGDDIIKNLFIAIYGRFTTVTNYLNTDVAGRMYKDIAEQGADFPYIVFEMISDVPDDTFTEDIAEVYIQFSLFSNTGDSTEIENMYSHLKELYDDCVIAPTGSYFINMSRVNTTKIDSAVTTESGESYIHGRAVDYLVTIQKH
jgi:hypothetical protein